MSKVGLNYLKGGYGLGLNVLGLLLLAIPASLIAFQRLFVLRFTDSDNYSNQSQSINYLFLIALISIAGGVGGLILPMILLRAGEGLHNSMLERVAGAPLSFYSSHPLGRILNRFSKDTATADITLIQRAQSIF